jgi:serine/threonine-protein kinase
MRKLLLAGIAVVALAGCAEQPMPAQWSARPGYYGEPPPYVQRRPAPVPYSYYPPPAPRRSAPLPADDPIPDQAQIAPPPVIPRPSPEQRPALVPADPDCGWWDPCHLWMGGAGT